LQAKEAVDQKLKSVEVKVNEKLGLFSANGANSGQLSLHSAGSLGINEKIALSIPNTAGVSVPELKTDIPELDPSIATDKITEVTNVELVGDLTNKVRDVTQLGAQAKGYDGYAKKIANGDFTDLEQLPEAAEACLMELDAMKGLKEETLSAEKYAEPLFSKRLGCYWSETVKSSSFPSLS
jgi:hypothetical protein